MATLTLPQNNSRIPTQSTGNSGNSNLVYPSDLITDSRNMYMLLTLNHYTHDDVVTPAYLTPYKQIALPIPFKLNDQTTASWDQASVVTVAANIVQSGLGYLKGFTGERLANLVKADTTAAEDAFSYYAAKVVNPFLAMLFKTQNFKDHVMQWVFAPNNQQEVEILHNIVEHFKAAMLPAKTSSFEGFLLDYPDVATLAFNVPTDLNGSRFPYLYNFKTCAITSVFLDWSGAGVPAFFKNGAPAVVSLIINFRETELWFRTPENGDGTYA